MKRASDLTNEDIAKASSYLVEFYKFSVFDGRDVDLTLALTLAVEQLAISLGLVGEWLYQDSSYTSVEMIQEFILAMDQYVMKPSNEMTLRDSLLKSSWSCFRGSLPYSRQLVTR